MKKMIISCLLLSSFILLSGCDMYEECIEVLDNETGEYKQYCEDDDDYYYHRTHTSYRSIRKSSSTFKSGGPGIRGK